MHGAPRPVRPNSERISATVLRSGVLRVEQCFDRARPAKRWHQARTLSRQRMPDARLRLVRFGTPRNNDACGIPRQTIGYGPIYFFNGAAFCCRCDAMIARDYPHPLRFHEPADCTRSSGDAAAQEKIVEGLRLVGAAGKTTRAGNESPARTTEGLAGSSCSDKNSPL